tara:strand:+ start:1541 stop:1774 length:234 start_codon:yes stop_codon:yes gene_type:complete
MQSKTEESYGVGYAIGVDAIDTCSQFPGENPRDVFAGLLTAVMAAGYFIAPEQSDMDSIIQFAQSCAIDKIAEGKES